MHQPVPDHLLALLAPPVPVIDLAAERERRAARVAAPAPRWGRYGAALAATLVLGVLLGTEVPRPSSDGILTTSAGFSARLETTPSAQAVALNDGAKLTPVLSFVRRNGQPCRQFALDAGNRQQAGIACRAGGRWTVEALVPHAPSVNGGGYATAGGADDGLDAAFAALKAGDPLDTKAEAAVIARGWKAR